jgi:hypothetical protein
MTLNRIIFLVAGCIAACVVAAEPDVSLFRTPPHDAHPETWFHLIGGNVEKMH